MRPLSRIPLSLVFLLLLTVPATAEVVDIGSAKDAQVAFGYTANNYGSSNNIFLQSSSAGFKDERAWMQFNLAGQLPPGAVITSAKLRLFCFKADTANNLATSLHGSDTDTWGETTLTWNTQPTLGAALSSATLIKGEEGVWIEWDATAFVQGQMSGDQAASLMVKPTTEGAATPVSFSFDSREYSASLAPRLRIEYTGSWSTAGGFTIFHMNDVHARVTPHELDVPGHDDVPAFVGVGGAAHFTTKLMEMKAANADSLVIDGGDVSEGNPVGDLRGNGAMIDFYNLLDTRLKSLGGRGIDAAVVGNHDIRTLQYINNLKNNATYPVISMNVCQKGTQTPYFAPYRIITVNGTKVGILGFTNDESTYMEPDSALLVDIVKTVWDDTDSTTINIKDYVNTLRTTEGCDVVILVNHIGQSRLVSGSDALIEDIGGVRPPEIVVSGHWHSYTDTAWKPAQLNGKTLIVEAASYLQYLGELQVTGDGKFVQALKHPITTASITPDPAMEALVNAQKAEYAATSPPYALDQIIGYSADNLRLDKDKWWTMNEFPWSGDNAAGSWISDAMVWMAGASGHPSQLAMQSGGGVRRDVPAGPVTFLQIYETYPWMDDNMVQVTMTGQEIWDFIETDYCGTSLSSGWLVTADDGIISAITYQGNPINLGGSYNVLISEYMGAHVAPFNTKTATPVGGAIRQAVVEYTGRFTVENPMTVPGPRYNLDTELAGGFRAVVTMVDDKESEPYYEAAFVRLLSALPETVARRDSYGLTDLVNADGSINPDHQFAESMLYRSHLGLADGELKPGDIIEIWVEGGFHDGNPQLVEQEGVQPSGAEFNIVGFDVASAQPVFHASIASFWNNDQENHLVTFIAKKTGANTVMDSAGQAITIYQPGGYYSVAQLPGTVGQYLQITGVNTGDGSSRRFRLRDATLSSFNGFPPVSAIDAVSPAVQSTAPLALTATASDPVSVNTAVAAAAMDAQVVEGYPTSNYGTKTYLYTQSATTGSYLDERSWLQFNLSGLIPAGAQVTAARLKLYCWKAGSANMAASVHSVNDDTWTETGLTWNSQPAIGAAIDSKTLSAGATGLWYSWDVTSFVQTQTGSSDTTISLVVKPQTEGSATALTYGFDSREYATTSMRPVLEVDYSLASSGSGVASVSFEQRFSADGTTYGAWSAFSQDTASPYATTFTYPAGYGHYEFRSIATDTEGNLEPAPLTADAAVQFILVDSDNDGLADGIEDVNHNGIVDPGETDPHNDDTDGDGYNDGDEVNGGTNPLDPQSYPATSDGDIPFMGPVGYALWASVLAAMGARRARRERKARNEEGGSC